MRLIRLFYDLLFNSFQVRRSNLNHFLYRYHWINTIWHPLPYRVHYFWPAPTGHNIIRTVMWWYVVSPW
jgi:hypothetical protein